MPNQTLPVGQAYPLPGTEGFTMACFKASDVPTGTNLYTLPPMAEDPDINLIARVFADFREEACIHGSDRVDGAFIKAARRLLGAAAADQAASAIGPDQRQAIRIGIDLAEANGYPETSLTLRALLIATRR